MTEVFDKVETYSVDANGKVLKPNSNNKFTQEMCDILVQLAASGETHAVMCEAVGIMPITLSRWLNPSSGYFKKGFYDLFIPAYKFGADILEGKSHAEAMDRSNDLYQDIGKDGSVVMRPNMAAVQRSKLIADNYHRMAGHRNSMKYGRVDRAILAGAGDINIQIIQYGGNGDKKELPESTDVKPGAELIESGHTELVENSE